MNLISITKIVTFTYLPRIVKKYVLISVLLFISIQKSLGQCQFSSGSPIHTKQASYFCHQYVKAALLGNWVDMSTGIPTHPESNFLSYSGEIATDPNFIRVCSINDARAIVPAPFGNTAYHSAIKLNNGLFASTPDADSEDIFTHQSATAFTTACPQNVQYFAAIPYITKSGVSAVNQGTQFTLTLTNNGQSFPSFIQLSSSNWRINETGNYFTEVTRTATSITLIANSLTGNPEVRYKLPTGCNGDNFFRVKTVQIMPNCTGTLNGGALNTFNMVPTGPNQVVMYLNSWTWVRTSGTASWSTSNGGKNMTFTISSGCSTFNAYNASCNLTFTFCKGSSFSSYTVMDMKTLKVIKEGMVEGSDMNTILDELPEGAYVINVDGNTTRYVKSN
jgi:hypothetical protein